MVEVGLVPQNVAEEAGYREVFDDKKAGGGGSTSSFFGSASDGWRSRVPFDFNGGNLRPATGGAGGASPRGGGNVPRMNWAGSGSGSSKHDKRSWDGVNALLAVDPMDVDEVRGAGGGAGGGSPSATDAPLGKKDLIRKENRTWNLRHMKTAAEGNTGVCIQCRVHSDSGVMMCSTQDLAEYHSFCFKCLAKKDNVSKPNIVMGSVKWECPTYRNRDARPKPDSRLPFSLRGAAWEGGAGLTAPRGTVPHQGSGQQAFGAGGRSKEVERGVAAGGHAGMKRSFAPIKLPSRVGAATFETEESRRSAPPPSVEILSSRSAEGESRGGGYEAGGGVGGSGDSGSGSGSESVIACRRR